MRFRRKEGRNPNRLPLSGIDWQGGEKDPVSHKRGCVAPGPPARRLTRWKVIEPFGGCLPVPLPGVSRSQNSGQPDRQRGLREAVLYFPYRMKIMCNVALRSRLWRGHPAAMSNTRQLQRCILITWASDPCADFFVECPAGEAGHPRGSFAILRAYRHGPCSGTSPAIRGIGSPGLRKTGPDPLRTPNDALRTGPSRPTGRDFLRFRSTCPGYGLLPI